MAVERRSVAWLSVVVAACCVVLVPRSAAADGDLAPPAYALTLGGALELARARAPAVLAARARIDGARDQLAYAERILVENPAVEVGAGPRFGDDETTLDLDVGIGQRFTLGGERAARIEAADAGVDLAMASAEAAERRALLEVARAFVALGRADRLVGVAADAERLAGEVARVADRRYETGEAGVLDVHLASLAVALAGTRRQGLESARSEANAALRDLLALEPSARIALPGDFPAPEGPGAGAVDLDALLAGVESLPRLRALEAALRGAEAEVRRGESGSWPDLGLRVGYGREEGADLVTGGISIGLPLVDRGQGIEAPARVRARELRLERLAAERVARSRILAAFEAHAGLAAAAERFQREGLPRIEQGEELARRSYEAGAMQLADLLAVRRELVDARRDHVNLLFDVALARVELEAAAGVLR